MESMIYDLSQQCIYFIIKMNAMIKLNSIEYLQVLQELVFSKIHPKDTKISIVKLPFYNFITLLTAIYSQYVQQTSIQTLNLFILHYFQKKYQSRFDSYRHMYGLITMWKKYVDKYAEARMFLSMLGAERNSRDNVKMFLKIRKNILRTIGPKVMQEIILTHQDVIALAHTLFITQMKNYTSKKIHELFFALKKKSQNNTKYLFNNQRINGAVICQFMINCVQKYERQELAPIKDVYEPEYKQPEQYIKRRIVVPVNKQEPIRGQIQEEPSFGQESVPVTNNTGKFALYPDKTPLKNNFLLNNLSSSKEKQKMSLTPDRTLLNQKYSYSWQKFLQTNQEMKHKLLNTKSEL